MIFIYENEKKSPQFKIVDLVDEDVESDDYAITVDAFKESESFAENEPLQTTEDTPASNEEQHEEKVETDEPNTAASGPAKKYENSN